MIFIGLYSWNRLHLSCRFADILYIEKSYRDNINH